MRLLVLLAFLFSTQAFGTQLLRAPTIHNGSVVFVFQNDLWTATDAGERPRRLTATKAIESSPRFSPDGKWIAFSSNREGYLAVFVMPASGGEPKQLTFFGGDRVVGWTPDGQRVVFSSQRNVGFGGTQSLWEVPLAGGLEQRILADRAAWGAYSPDGKRFAYNRHAPQGYRRHYRGSAHADLWLMDVGAKTFKRLDDESYQGDNAWPMFGRDGFVYFAADRLANEKDVKPGSPGVMKSVGNLWKVSEKGGKPQPVTHFASGWIVGPSMSADGRSIVYEKDFGIWKLDVASGRTAEIKVDLDSEAHDSSVQTITIDSEAESFDLSPSTKRAAIASGGSIYTIATELGEVQRVTDTLAHDRLPKWSPDGKKIVFVSDRSGRDEIWMSDERGSLPKQLTDADGPKTGLTWTPDSKLLLYASDDAVMRLNVADGKSDLVVKNGIDVSAIQISPDARWLAYSVATKENLVRTFVRSIETGEEHSVSRKGFARSYSPVWTPDGKKLLILSSNAGAVDRPQAILYAITLRQESANPNYKGVDEEPAAAKTDAAAPDAAKRPAAKPDVKIDWGGIERRTRQVSRLSEHINSVAVAPDSRTYAVVAAGQIYTLDEEGGRQIRIAAPTPGRAPSGLQFSKDGRTIYFREGTGIFAVAVTPPPTPAPAAKRKVSFLARKTVNTREQRRYSFLEAWRAIRNGYYNPALNGLDWDSVRKSYEPLLAFVDDQEGLADLLRMMIGELNTSHTSAFAPLPTASPRPGGAHPGFELEADPSGYYKVSHVLKSGPADRDFSKVKTGDFLLEVNGKPLKAGDNYWQAFRSSPGRSMELTLNSKPSPDGAWRTRLNPAVDPRSLYYEEWVAERRAQVDKASNGEFAYIHLRVMAPDILAQFEEDIYEARFKKGLILDVRFNGGGNLEMELLKILNQRAYMQLITRRGVVFPRPYRGFYGSMVVIQNENSGSNAEMFPLGFRQLGLGPVVGVPTPGFVLLSGETVLSDGTRLLLGHGSVKGLNGQSLENNGVVPDFIVDNSPEDNVAGRDAQLLKAVEVLRSGAKGK
ncbi:MAG: S41 family peptidase [Bryobacteraceae bacterium]